MVKRFWLIASLLIIIITGCKSYNFDETFSYQPEKPQPGEELTIIYNPDSTILKNSESIISYFYFYSNKLDTAISLDMEKEGKGWISKVKVPSDQALLLVKFTDGEAEKEDNNGEMIYIVEMYDDSGTKMPEAAAAYAVAKAARGGVAGMKTDREKGISLFEESFKTNPELMRKFGDEYLFNINRFKGSEANDIISGKLAELEELNDGSEDALLTLAKWYREIGDSVKSNQYRTELDDNFPFNSLAESDAYLDIYNEQDIPTKIEMLREFENKFPGSTYITRIYYTITSSYLRTENYDDLAEFLISNSKRTHMISFYNAVNYMLGKDQSTETALRISTAGIERSNEDIVKPKSPKPAYYTDDEWLELNRSWAAYNFLGHSKVLKTMGDVEEALIHSRRAVDLTNGEDSEVNEYNIALLLELNRYDDVIGSSEEFIKSGTATQKIKENFKEAYLASKGSEEEFEKHLSSLESDASSVLFEELKELMIEERAEDFTLTNLDGNDVGLADMKGKVVILDFWATWCGPCLNSFPGMKLAVEKFQADEEVEFLFINTWERVENKRENAAQFINDNDYPFHVLMDTENKVVSDYGVSGIPTKFIIDGSGKIRFKSVGFDGNTDHLVDELSAMISLAKGES